MAVYSLDEYTAIYFYRHCMLDFIVPLTKKFISIKSIPGNPQGLQEILDLALLNLSDFTIERFIDNGVKSALVYKAKRRPKKFKILLNGHLDIIPGKEYQYRPQVKGNRLYGVGAMDMKANVACLIAAFKQVAEGVSYPLGLQLVTDEEIGGFHGTKFQVGKGVRSDFVLAGEPTNFDIVHKAKGVLWIKVSARGKTAHGAYPWRGENAVWKMHDFLSALKKKYPVPLEQKWVTTVNVSRIETSNQTMNKIPDDCFVALDIRYVPEDAGLIVKNLRSILPTGCKLEVVAEEPSLSTDEKNEYIKILGEVSKEEIRKKIYLRGAQGTSDARHFSRVGSAGIEFGPIGGGIGSDSEWVDIPSLKNYYSILVNFLRAIH